MDRRFGLAGALTIPIFLYDEIDFWLSIVRSVECHQTDLAAVTQFLCPVMCHCFVEESVELDMSNLSKTKLVILSILVTMDCEQGEMISV